MKALVFIWMLYTSGSGNQAVTWMPHEFKTQEACNQVQDAINAIGPSTHAHCVAVPVEQSTY